MPRIARKNIQSEFVHIITKGIKSEFIFYKDQYKNEYILLLKKCIKEMIKTDIVSYSIMANHAHILIHTKSIDEISKLMRKINTAYAIYYNKSEEREGFVFANRYYSQDIKDVQHLFACIKYIHDNPVKAGIVKDPSQYKFSSFKEFNEGKLDTEVAKLIFGTENYVSKFNNLEVEGEFNIIDISDEEDKNKITKKANIERLIDNFCEKFEVNLSQIRGSNYLILKFKEYLEQFKISNKTICGILGIGKNRINYIEKRKR